LGGIRAEGARPHPSCHSHTSIPYATADPAKLLRNVPVLALGADRDDTAPSAGHRRRSARAVPHTVNDDFITGHFVEDQVWIRASDEAAQALAAGSGAQVGVVKREVDEPLNAGLHLARAVGRLRLDIGEHLAKIGYGVRRVTEFQSPYFAQTARTSLSVANSRRSACASDSRNEASSSGVSSTTG